MTDLSPAAHAVDRAIADCIQLLGEIAPSRQVAAAALRAAADQVVPEEQNSDFVPGAPRAYEIQRRVTRHQLLALAAELEGIND